MTLNRTYFQNNDTKNNITLNKTQWRGVGEVYKPQCLIHFRIFSSLGKGGEKMDEMLTLYPRFPPYYSIILVFVSTPPLHNNWPLSCNPLFYQAGIKINTTTMCMKNSTENDFQYWCIHINTKQCIPPELHTCAKSIIRAKHCDVDIYPTWTK